MGKTTNPNVYWTIRTISPRLSHGENHTLRLLHVLITQSGCGLESGLTRYPDMVPIEFTPQDDKKRSQPVAYVLDQLTALSDSTTDLRLLSFVFPYASGYIIRSDFLQVRLQTLLKDHDVYSFRQPLQYCEYVELQESSKKLFDVLDSAVGVISRTIGPEFDQKNHEDQICDRLSYPWLSLHPIPRRRIALVRGRPNYRVGGPVYSAAKALGVSLIVIDEDQHWLQADTRQNKDLREAFLTIDMKESSGLPYRIVAAIKDYPAQVDGIFTLSDNYLVAVAQAAELLGSPTSPSSAYEIAFDKGLTRQLQAASFEYANVKTEGDLHELLTSGNFRPQYPLIVKPRTRGWNSQYVRKVCNQEDLFSVIRAICPRYNDGVVVEPYHSGPEIDVNVVMANGKVIFQEIVDEPPSYGDHSDESSADFLENGMRAPSILPLQEQRALFGFVSELLLQLGLANGVFHVEGRISRSSMEIRDVNGVIDLVPISPTPSEDVQFHLIEINARPPGLRAQILTQLTYGVDYFAVQILSAVNDEERTRASCQPFNLPAFPQVAQSWSQLVHLPVLSKGKTDGIAVIERLLHRLPDVVPYVFEYQCCFDLGDSLPDPAECVEVFGHCVVSSTQSRGHVVEIADRILKAYRESGSGKSMKLDFKCENSNALDQCVAPTLGNEFSIGLGK